MASGSRYTNPYGNGYTTSGASIPGALLSFYLSGSSTPANTYTDSSLTTPNANPVVADASGTFPAIFLDPTIIYKAVLTYPPVGNASPVEVWTADPVVAPSGANGPFSQSAAYTSGTMGAFLQGLYAIESPGVVSFGNKPDGSAAAIRIGSNNAFAGTGSLQVGGAGIKDGGNGAYIANDGHPNWNAIQSTIPFNPTEWNVYGNGVGGIATSDGAGHLTKTSGTDWTTLTVGDTIWFAGVAYTSSVITDATHITVTGGTPGSGTNTWIYCYTTGSGTCTVASGVCTRVTGDPFIAHTFGTGFTFKLNGTAYTVTVDGGANSCTISSPPADGTYSYSYKTNINDQVATLRLQGLVGSSEENLSLWWTPSGAWMHTLFAGSGSYRDIIIGAGELTSGVLMRHIVCHADGDLSLGGDYNYDAIRVLKGTNVVNRLEMQGAATGVGPALRARGSDTDVPFGFDTQGAGYHVFTTASFAHIALKAGGSGNDYLQIDTVTGAPTITAVGSSTNVDISLIPKGTGTVKFGAFTSNADAPITGYVTIKDSGGTTRKLAVIA